MLWSNETEAPGNPTHKYTERGTPGPQKKKKKLFDYTNILHIQWEISDVSKSTLKKFILYTFLKKKKKQI